MCGRRLKPTLLLKRRLPARDPPCCPKPYGSPAQQSASVSWPHLVHLGGRQRAQRAHDRGVGAGLESVNRLLELGLQARRDAWMVREPGTAEGKVQSSRERPKGRATSGGLRAAFAGGANSTMDSGWGYNPFDACKSRHVWCT